MRKNANIFCAAALMSALCTGFVACNEPKGPEQPEEPEVIGVAPVPEADVPEEVTAFFKKYLPDVSGINSEIFFVDQDGNKCLMVNNAEELKAIMSSSVELPPIDFEKYTLIVGQATMPGTGFTSPSQGLNGATLNLKVKKPDGTYWVMCPLYYWGLYPKLSKAAISINVIHEK